MKNGKRRMRQLLAVLAICGVGGWSALPASRVMASQPGSDKQRADIVTIDLTGKSALADTMIVASGRSQRHVSAVADHLLRALKEGGHGSARVEGLPHSDWVLIDTGDVIVHLFRPEVRVFYNLEKLWLAVANAEGPAPGSA